MKRWERWTFNSLTAAVAVTGFIYFWMKYFVESSDPFAVINHPWQTAMLNLGVADLQPVLDHIAHFPPAEGPDLRPVPPDKLKHNMLSSHVETLLTAGISRSDLVHRYFRAGTDQGAQDKIAAMFQKQYSMLKSENRSPDDIFVQLQYFVGGTTVSLPSRQAAVFAVLAYFFQECDIFERPEAKP